MRPMSIEKLFLRYIFWRLNLIFQQIICVLPQAFARGRQLPLYHNYIITNKGVRVSNLDLFSNGIASPTKETYARLCVQLYRWIICVMCWWKPTQFTNNKSLFTKEYATTRNKIIVYLYTTIINFIKLFSRCLYVTRVRVRYVHIISFTTCFFERRTRYVPFV